MLPSIVILPPQILLNSPPSRRSEGLLEKATVAKLFVWKQAGAPRMFEASALEKQDILRLCVNSPP